MSDPEVCRLVAEYVAAWNARDADGVARLFAADGSYGEFGTGEIMLGARQIRRQLAAAFAAVPDLTTTLTGHPTCSRECVLYRWIMTGTLQGRFAGLSPTGDRFEIRGATALVLRSKMILRAAHCFALSDFADQPGGEEHCSPSAADAWPVASSTDLFGGRWPLADEDNIGYGE